MPKVYTQSRTGRRMNTKSAMHKACQQATKGTLRRAKRAHTGTGKVRTHPALPLFNVRNSGTKREIQIHAATSEDAIAIALGTPYRLAKSEAKLTATAVS